MPERATKSQRLQFGWETTYNTVATAVRRLLSLGIDIDVQATRKKNFAQGYNFPSSTSMEKDFTEGDMNGPLMFDEVIVPLSMALGATTGVAQTPASAIKWTWNVPLSGDITPKSATVEKGDANTGERVAGMVCTDLEFSWSRDSIDIKGSVMGTLLDAAATMATSGVTTFPQVPMNPNGIGCFIDTTSGGLGTTRMLRVFEGGLKLGSLFGQIWPLNELKPSFDGVVATMPDSETTITIMADTAGKALLANLRAGDRRFLRWYCKGPVIGAGPATYLFQVDMAIEVVDIDKFDDSDGIYAVGITFAPMADETWGSAMIIAVVNTTTVY